MISENRQADARREREPSETPQAYLVFELADIRYALRVQDVREIITSVSISKVPGSPEYLSGVTNLRGRILPIIDLRKRFLMDDRPCNERECYVVLAVESAGDMVEFGVHVDAVHEVFRISSEHFDEVPSLTQKNALAFNGVARTESGIKLMLDSKAIVKQLQQDIQFVRSVRETPHGAGGLKRHEEVKTASIEATEVNREG